MNIFNGEFYDLSSNVKIIGKIPIEFNENQDDFIKATQDLMVVQEENGDLCLSLATNRGKEFNYYRLKEAQEGEV